MAKQSAKEEEKVITPSDQALSHLNAHKEDHFNFEDTITDRTRASSLLLSAAMDGGLEPGAHRAVGVTTGGKTSCTLDFMYHFLKVNQGKLRRGVYVKSEGRLSPEVIARSGVVFTTDPKEWKDGTCLLLESNVFEFVFSFFGDLIRNNPLKVRYFFMIDSMDTMGKRADLAKTYEDAAQVAGGAVITSVFFKKTGVALAKRGHIMWFISQVRDFIKVTTGGGGGAPTAPRQGNSSGGHAVEHAGDWVLEFMPRWKDDVIRENADDDNSKPVGHYCKIRIVKSNNEKYTTVIRYPIKYGRINATSVWVEREIADLLIQWELVTRDSEKGAMYTIAPALVTEVKEATGEELPEKIRGRDNIYKLLENNPKITAFLYEKFLKLITGK
jgi:RecA/RadA recombinase